MMIALVLLAIIAGASVIIARRTTVSIIIRKDNSDMVTIKERLAALEGAQGDHVSKTDLDALASRVDVIEAEIGSDPAPADTQPAAQVIDPNTGLPVQQ